MPTGQERLVLAACDELAGHGHGFVLASDIAGKTGMGLRAVQDCLRGLDRDGFIDLVPLENGDLRASVTPRGRQELAKMCSGRRDAHPEAPRERQVKVVPKGLRSFDEHDADFFLELLPGPRRGGRTPREHPLLEDPDRGDRPGQDLPGGCDLRAVRLRQVVAGQGGLTAQSGRTHPVDSSRSDPDETETRLLKGFRKPMPRIADGLRTDPGRSRPWARGGGFAGPEGLARPRPVRAVALYLEGRRADGIGHCPAAMRRRPVQAIVMVRG